MISTMAKTNENKMGKWLACVALHCKHENGCLAQPLKSIPWQCQRKVE
jgi:hypothetical protein